jgi:hypothetical protein
LLLLVNKLASKQVIVRLEHTRGGGGAAGFS